MLTIRNIAGPIDTDCDVRLLCDTKYDICSPSICIDYLNASLNGLLHTPYLILYHDLQPYNIFDGDYCNAEVIALRIISNTLGDVYIDEDSVLNSFPNLLILYVDRLKRFSYKKIAIIIDKPTIPYDGSHILNGHPIKDEIMQILHQHTSTTMSLHSSTSTTMSLHSSTSNKFIREIANRYKLDDKLLKNAYHSLTQ